MREERKEEPVLAPGDGEEKRARLPCLRAIRARLPFHQGAGEEMRACDRLRDWVKKNQPILALGSERLRIHPYKGSQKVPPHAQVEHDRSL